MEDILSVLDDLLAEVRVVRRKRVPASVRIKRKRYYRKKKASIKRKAKVRRRKPKQKRLAKRRAKFKKRFRIKPGSRRRIQMNSLSLSGSIMEARMNKIELIRGFNAAKKVAEALIEEKVAPVKNPFSIKFLDDQIDLPEFDFQTESLDAPIPGFEKKESYCEATSVARDAARIAEDLKNDSIDEGEALQILKFMTEYLDQATASLSENEEDFSEIVEEMKRDVLILAISVEMEEAGLHSEIRGELTDTVPAFIKSVKINFDELVDQVPTEPFVKLIKAQNKKFDGKITVQELVDEFGMKVATRLALGANGHAVAMDDDMEVSNKLKALSLDGRPAYHIDEVGMDVAMDFVDSLKGDQGE